MGPPASAGGPTQPSADELQQQTGTMTQIINSHFIVGNMPFERTRLFSEPDETMVHTFCCMIKIPVFITCFRLRLEM
jgi:hypothetical protein